MDTSIHMISQFCKKLQKKIKKKIVCCLLKSNQRVTDVGKEEVLVNSFWITCVWKKNSLDVHTHCFRPWQVFCVVTSLVCFERALPPQVSGFVIRWRHISTLFSSLKIEKPCVGKWYSKHGISYITCIIFSLSCCWCWHQGTCFLMFTYKETSTNPKIEGHINESENKSYKLIVCSYLYEI